MFGSRIQILAIQALILIGMTTSAMAQEWSGQIGLRNNTSKVDASGASSKDKIGFQLGALTSFPLNENVKFRTGALLVQRDGGVQGGGLEINVSRLFLDVPVTIAAGTNVVWGYVGFDLGLKLSSTCSTNIGLSCTLSDEKSMVIQPVLGVEFAASPTITVGAFYELETELSKNWKQSAIGVTGGMSF